jgi:DNA mismatch endonuclease, patch repair protein
MEQLLRRKLPGGAFLEVSKDRSRTMSAIKSRGNLTTEQRLRSALVRAGIRGWTVQPKGFVGSPDFYFHREKLIVFVDGCFWHGCPKCGHIPKTNRGYWKEKVKRNGMRDRRNARKLQSQGFTVMRFWEHQLCGEIQGIIGRVRDQLERNSSP